jgi:large subunit ribosomal protein L1
MKRSKNYRKNADLIDQDRLYPPGEAIALAKQTNPVKFDATVEMAMRLGVDPRKADQMVRGTVSLPKGTGRTVRVAAFAAGDKAREAREAGADLVGGEDLVQEILKGNIDFEAAVATPDMMPAVGKAGRVLGPRGLMPNPKAGTVTEDIAKAVADIKGGKLEYRVDRQGNVHLLMGKRSFDEQALMENFMAIMDEIIRAKPAAAKGRYLRSVTVSSTMGPGIRIDPAKLKDSSEAVSA